MFVVNLLTATRYENQTHVKRKEGLPTFVHQRRSCRRQTAGFVLHLKVLLRFLSLISSLVPYRHIYIGNFSDEKKQRKRTKDRIIISDVMSLL